ncbi:YibE/F family protein [Loigolactobacillus jiayinensis]|uniref:YibE/F family protein n=1 Tax=Loigolactobacillus jiayinensis TaxID=2486016 RepID=A0ABW1R916_9LACO|nr:YibE/F family protein [Loigolactobacillus jiayinensis]
MGKLKRWWPLLLILVGGLLVLGTRYAAPLYRQSIMQVTASRVTEATKTSDEFKNSDKQYTQYLTGRLLNGQRRGHTVHVKNTYSASGAMDEKYSVGEQVFISHTSKNILIKGLKRDTVMLALLWLAVVLLVVMLHRAGLMALLSVALNLVIFFLAIEIDLARRSDGFLWLFGGLALIFAALTLWLILGPTKQMLITFAATVTGTALSIGLSALVLALTHHNGIYYETMAYVTQVAPQPLFLAATLLGSLGAVMDESTDIVATLFELRDDKPTISALELFQAGRQVGTAIMGPLINVLLLIFIAETMPIALLLLKNGNSWGYTFSMTMSLGMAQSLISGIGIVLAIPVVSFLASRLLVTKAGVSK